MDDLLAHGEVGLAQADLVGQHHAVVHVLRGFLLLNLNLKFELTYPGEEDILSGAIAKKGLHGHRGLILRVRVVISLDPLVCGDGA